MVDHQLLRVPQLRDDLIRALLLLLERELEILALCLKDLRQLLLLHAQLLIGTLKHLVLLGKLVLLRRDFREKSSVELLEPHELLVHALSVGSSLFMAPVGRARTTSQLRRADGKLTTEC